jgi:hypothetical protein
VLTEWGLPGAWSGDSTMTSWGAPIELSSTAKAAWSISAYQSAVGANAAPSVSAGAWGSQPVCMGSFAFIWGAKLEVRRPRRHTDVSWSRARVVDAASNADDTGFVLSRHLVTSWSLARRAAGHGDVVFDGDADER